MTILSVLLPYTGFVVSWEQCSQDCFLPVKGCSTDMEPAFWVPSFSVRLLSESGRQVWDSLSSKYSTRFTDFAFQHVSKKKVSTSTNTENLLITKLKKEFLL